MEQAATATLIVEGTPEFGRSTEAALALLRAYDPERAGLVTQHIRRLTGLGRRDAWRLGRATLYDRNWQALTRRVEYAWVDRRRRQCFVTPAVWQVSLDDAVALRRYASVLVHEAAHLYLDTDDEDRCNAEMHAALQNLTPGSDRLAAF